MGQYDQIEVAGQRLLGQAHTVEPTYYRDPSVLPSPFGAHNDRHTQNGFASTSQVAAEPHKVQQKQASYPTSPFQQAFEYAPVAEDKDAPSWYQNAVPPNNAAEAANTALAAIANAAATVGNKLAWWGTYLTDIVADVTGDDEVTEEQIQKEEQQRLAEKEASKYNHESVSGDVAQPLTRRHSRSLSRENSLPRGASLTSRLSSGNLARGMSGTLVRGASTFLDESWQAVPVKAPGPNLPKSPAPNGTHGSELASATAMTDEDEFVKKDT